jgi:hypothetical protein
MYIIDCPAVGVVGAAASATAYAVSNFDETRAQAEVARIQDKAQAEVARSFFFRLSVFRRCLILDAPSFSLRLSLDALSSAESELISACSATQNAVYICQLLVDRGLKQDGPTMIMEENQACIAMSNNPILQKRTKHIDVRYHFVRENFESKEVELVYIRAQHQADITTKPVLSIRLAMIHDQMMGYKF